MKNVRKDVRTKLMQGLIREQQRAKRLGSSVPNRWGYTTRKAKHYIYVSYKYGEIWFNSEEYNGTRCHTTVKM